MSSALVDFEIIQRQEQDEIIIRYDICAYFCAFLPIYTVMVLASHLPVSSRPIWPPSRIGAAWLLSFAVTLRRLQFPDSGGYILG